jgi:hypothetical protein
MKNKGRFRKALLFFIAGVVLGWMPLKGKGYYVYGDIRTRVTVDWSADVRAIAAFDWSKGNLRVVTRSDGKEFPVVWEGAEPNRMVWRYLRRTRVRPSSNASL